MNEHEREIAEAWREASGEEPPPALDAAIRAEAHRAVDARPGRAHRQWRYPAATAATVAVLAFGIARMTSRDAIEPIIVADRAPRQAQVAAPPPSREESTQLPDALAPSSSHEAARTPHAMADAKRAFLPQDIPAPAPSSPLAKEAPRKPEGVSVDRFAAAPAPPAARVDERAAGSPSAPAKVATTDAPSGIASKTEPSPSSAPQSAPPAASSNQPEENSVAGGTITERASLDTRTSRDAHALTPGTQALASKVQRQTAASAPAYASNATDELKAKEAGAESVDDWIARIRTLRSSGQLDAATREIVRFRSVYGDRANALLPSDLRGIAPSGVKGQ